MEGAGQEKDIPSVVQDDVSATEESAPPVEPEEQTKDEKAESAESAVIEEVVSDSHSRKTAHGRLAQSY